MAKNYPGLSAAENNQMARVKKEMNKFEWTKELDQILEEKVTTNHFNFEKIASGVSSEVQKRNLDDCSTAFNPQKCRIRWSYIHLKRKMKKAIKYPQLTVPQETMDKIEKQKESQEQLQQSIEKDVSDKENQESNSPQTKEKSPERIPYGTQKERAQAYKNKNKKPSSPKQKPTSPKKAVDKFEPKKKESVVRPQTAQNPTEKRSLLYQTPAQYKKEYLESINARAFFEKKINSYADIEKNLWKSNIVEEKPEAVDYLDISNVDFSTNVELDEQGNEVTPSGFNIFRDSLKATSDQMRAKMMESLPDVNFDDPESSAGESEDEEVVPLDFRTKLLKENFQEKVVIQAKPMHIKSNEEYLATIKEEEERDARMKAGSSEAFFEAMRKEAFEDTPDVFLLDPDTELDAKLDAIDLPCNIEKRINNSIDAPLMSQVQAKSKTQRPGSSKDYESDSNQKKAKNSNFREAQAHLTKAHNQQIQVEEKIIEEYNAMKDRQVQEQKEAQEQLFKSANLDADALEMEARVANHENSRLHDQLNAMQLAFSANKDSQKMRQEGTNPSEMLSFDNILSSMGSNVMGGSDALDEFIGDVPASSDEERKSSKPAGPTRPKVGNFMEETKKEKPEKVPAPKLKEKIEVVADEAFDEIDETPLPPVEQKKQEDPAVKKQKELEERKKAIQNSVKYVQSDSESETETKRRKVEQRRAEIEAADKARKSMLEQAQKQAQQDPRARGRYYRGVKVGEPKPEQKSSEESSDNAGEDFFAQQREAARKRQLENMRRIKQEQESKEKETNQQKEESEDSYDSAAELEKQRQAAIERQRRQAEFKKKQEDEEAERQAKFQAQIRAREERDKERREQEKQLAEIKAAEEKAQKELQDRLKAQNVERKTRKREEKNRKLKELAAQREKEEAEQREIERQEEAKRQEEMKIVIERERLAAEESERNRKKGQLEESMPKLWNGTDIPCMFDQKISYTKHLSQLPLDLEEQIEIGLTKTQEQRYKTLVLPYNDNFISGESLNQLIMYFLRNSSIRHQCTQEEDPGLGKNAFLFKCIGLQMTVMQPPFLQPSSNLIGSNNVYRSLVMLFDTDDLWEDNPKTRQKTFDQALKQVQLGNIFSSQNLKKVRKGFPDFSINLAHSYQACNSLQAWPYKMNESQKPLLAFSIGADQFLNNNSSTLDRLCYSVKNLLLRDEIPPEEQLSLELFRRSPQFYAFNPNPKKNSSQKKIKADFVNMQFEETYKVSNRFNDYNFENVAVVFKELMYGGPIESKELNLTTKCQTALEFFLERITGMSYEEFNERKEDENLELQGGLQVVGLRIMYLTTDQLKDFKDCGTGDNVVAQIITDSSGEGGSLFHANAQAYLSLVIRGPEAVKKVENIIGHFSPEIARNTKESSMRAFYGIDKQHNCCFNVHGTTRRKRNQMDLSFWSGGRMIEQTEETKDQESTQKALMYTIVPPPIEKHVIFLSPLVTTDYLPIVLQRLADNSITVCDVQKIDFSRLPYEAGTIQELNRNDCNFEVRGSTYNIQIGTMVRVARENLHEVLNNLVLGQMIEDLSGIIDTHGCELKQIMFISKDQPEYEVLKQRMEKNCLRVNYHAKPSGGGGTSGGGTSDDEIRASLKRLSDYDSEGIENFSHLNLYQNQVISSSTVLKSARGASQMSNQEKTDDFQTSTFLMFIKPSTFRKLLIGDVLNVILHQCGFEILGMRIIDMRKNLWYKEVPKSVQQLFKSVAYQFNKQHKHDEAKLKSKMFSFKTFVLVLRGMNAENRIDDVYDREKLHFRHHEQFNLETGAKAVFLTNQTFLKPFFSFVLQTKLLQLYHDMPNSGRLQHLMDSSVFSRLISAQSTPIGEKLFSFQNFIQIKKWEHLNVEEEEKGLSLSACVLVVKPNQPINVAIRTLKQIINKENWDRSDEPLTIQKLQVVQYNEEQIQLLYEHEFKFDQNMSVQAKQRYQGMFKDFFKAENGNSNKAVIQALIVGKNAISKVKRIVGDKDPKNAVKNTMRSFYANDRFDNSFFCSENFSESLLERDLLFQDEASSGHTGIKVVPKVKAQAGVELSPIDQIMLANTGELAVCVISPTLVRSGDFVYVLDELTREKFTIAALRKAPLTEADVQALFGDQRVNFNKEVLWQEEFMAKSQAKQNENEALVITLEKENAVVDLQSLFGKCSVTEKKHFESCKKKQRTGYGSFNTGPQTLVEEYGAYLYCFPGVQQNQRKVAHFFDKLPASKHFEVTWDVKK